MSYINYETSLQEAGYSLNENNPLKGDSFSWIAELFHSDVVKMIIKQIHTEVIPVMKLQPDRLYGKLSEECQNDVTEIRSRILRRDESWKILMEDSLIKLRDSFPDNYVRYIHDRSTDIVTLLLEIHYMEFLANTYGYKGIHWPFGKKDWAKTVMHWVNEYVENLSSPFFDGWNMEQFAKDFKYCWDTTKPKVCRLPNNLLSEVQVNNLFELLKKEKFIDDSSNVADWLFLFGHISNKQSVEKMKWLGTKSNLVKLFRGIYDESSLKDNISRAGLLTIIQKSFIGKNGKQYASMKYKSEISTNNDKIDTILNTIFKIN